MKIIAGNGNYELAKIAARFLDSRLTNALIGRFSDDEVRVDLRGLADLKPGEKLFIIQSTPPPAENWLELFLMLDAASQAEEVYVIMPYCGYACQDKPYGNQPISIRRLARFLRTYENVKGVAVVDIHSKHAIQAFDAVGLPFYPICAAHVFLGHLRSSAAYRGPITLVDPDAGSCPVTDYYERQLGDLVAARVSIKKVRLRPGEAKILEIVGRPKDGSMAIIIDDMFRSGGTADQAADQLLKMGARSVEGYFTHGIFCGEALEILQTNRLQNVYVTDTIPQRREVLQTGKVTEHTVADLIVRVIYCLDSGNMEGVKNLALPNVE